MKICVTGNGTLAEATRNCCRTHFDLTTSDDHFLNVLWVAHDTPIDERGKPDPEKVLEWIDSDLLGVSPLALIVISSQMPVGTTTKLERWYPHHSFAYQPENIRVKTAVQDFSNQPRVVVGVRDPKWHQLLADLFAPFTQRLIFTDPETAEMTKHALNTYLGMSIAYANEMAKLCKFVGADAVTVSEALRSDARISPKAPLLPGGPFNSGHLERDIFILNDLAKKHAVSVPIIENIMRSNSGL